MQSWLITILVAGEVKISFPDGQRHSLGLTDRFQLQIGRHGQVNWGQQINGLASSNLSCAGSEF